MQHHDLKIHPNPFGLFLCGIKDRWEIRRNDRDFQVDDTICLQEWDPETMAFTGSGSGPRRITIVYRHEDMPEAIQPGWCVFGHAPLERTIGRNHAHI